MMEHADHPIFQIDLFHDMLAITRNLRIETLELLFCFLLLPLLPY